MIKNIPILLIFTLVSISFFGQTKFQPPSNPKAKADALLEKYNKEDHKAEVASLLSTVEFDYRYVRKDETDDAFHTNITKTEEHHLMALKDDLYSYLIESYDDESFIKDYGIYGGSSLRKKELIRQKCHSNISESILSSDNVICEFVYKMESKGEIRRSKIEKVFKNVRYFTAIYFRSHFPTEEKVITFRVPDWLEIEFHEINFEGYDITKSEKTITKGDTYTEHIYIVRNLDSRPKEDFMPGSTYFEPHIAINVKRINHEKNSKPLFSSNDDVYGWYRQLLESCDNESSELKAFTDELVSGLDSDEEKLKKIYYWLQDNIRYIAYEDGIMGFRPENAKDVFSQKYGDCKGMANLAKTMLVHTGFDARLTWIGTNRIGPAYDYSFPSLANDNHMICTVLKDGKQIFIDPTEQYIRLGEHADRIQGRKVMIEDGENYILSTVPEEDVDRNQVKDKWDLYIDGDLLKGKVHNQYSGQRKVSIMNGYASTKSQDKEDVLKDFLEGGDKNLKVSNYVSAGLDNRDVPITFNYDLSLQNAILNVNDDLYLSLEMDRNFSDTDVNLPREMDIYFGSKIHSLMDVTLKIPDGYTVDYVPNPLTIESEDFEISASYKQEGKQIIYQREIKIPKGIVDRKHAEDWNTSIEKLNELYDDQLILKKQQ